MKKAGIMLPCESSVCSWVGKYDIVPEINKQIIDKIEKYLVSAPPEDIVWQINGKCNKNPVQILFASFISHYR